MSSNTLCLVDDIEDGGALGVQAKVNGVDLPLVAVRIGDDVWVYVNSCPHFSVVLDFQPGVFCTYSGARLMCAHHSAMFRFEDGLCTEGPCKGRSLEKIPTLIAGRDVRILHGEAH